MIYFVYFHTVMEYGIIFWGASAESKRIFQQQNRIIRIMTGSTSRTSCSTLFQKLEILTDFSIHTLFNEIPLIQCGDLHIQYFST
jgi:hypothetical protein